MLFGPEWSPDCEFPGGVAVCAYSGTSSLSSPSESSASDDEGVSGSSGPEKGSSRS